MRVYDVNGNPLSSAYDVEGHALSAVYDVEGNLLDGVVFADETTITDIYTSTRTQQPQGGCIDDNGNVYTCFYKAGFMLKHNLTTGAETQNAFTSEAYGHANGMTYNPNTGYLYLASMNDTGEVFVFDTADLSLVDTLYARDGGGTVFNCWNIAYDRTGGRFVVMSGGTIYFFDDDFVLISTGTYDVNDWAQTRQDIETDGTYIYALSFNPNKICVFDMNGHLVKQIVNTAFSGEPESMCYDWTNEIFYIEGKSSYYVIRKAEFVN